MLNLSKEKILSCLLGFSMALIAGRLIAEEDLEGKETVQLEVKQASGKEGLKENAKEDSQGKNSVPPATAEPVILEDPGSELVNNILSGIGTSPDEKALLDVVKNSLRFIRISALNDPEGFFVPPERMGFKEVEMKLVEKTRIEPVYEYETYAAIERNSAGEMVEVKKRRIIKQTGTREVKHLVADPNGNITRKRRIYGGSGETIDFFNAGVLGQNGICLYASLKCGISYDESVNSRCIASLIKYLDYSLPDHTYDLAWLTAAFVNLPKENKEYSRFANAMVNKLLLGQIDDNKAKGLWGPVCVNPGVISKMSEHERNFSGNDIKDIKEKLKQKPEDEKLAKKLQDAKSELENFQSQFANYSQLVPLNGYQDRLKLYGIGKTNTFQGFYVAGMLNYLFGENLADMESTAVALFALKEASRNGYLPKTTKMPEGKKNKRLLPPVNITTVMNNAFDKIVKLQNKDHVWDESNFLIPVHDFDSMGYLGTPVNDKEFANLKSECTAMSRCFGYSALKSVSEIVKKEKSLEKLLRNAGPAIEEDLKTILGKTSAEDKGLRRIQAYPNEYFFFLSELSDGFPQIRADIARRLLLQPYKIEDAVDSHRKYSHLTSSMREYIEFTAPREYEKRQATLPEAERKAWTEEEKIKYIAARQNVFPILIDMTVTANAYDILTGIRLLGSGQPSAGAK